MWVSPETPKTKNRFFKKIDFLGKISGVELKTTKNTSFRKFEKITIFA